MKNYGMHRHKQQGDHISILTKTMGAISYLVSLLKFFPCKDQDVGGWIILGRILERWDVVMWTGLVWLRIGTGGELL
jgi:hypothetical protein